ncbi:spexin isoform X2 [Protopterus annectens]|uniref:spexin isoform X2 n=1 Tax=Protopterus annectens TaxID=7888 RepID=UPI001CFB6682|nr:spexin isoform X2 [Protopterus annectens]
MKGLRRPTAYALTLLLAASCIASTWAIPQGHFQRRNWTPQAMLYLKGAQGRRFISDDRKEGDGEIYDRLQLETRSHSSDPISFSEAAAMLIDFIRQAQEGVEADETDQFGSLHNILNWRKQLF